MKKIAAAILACLLLGGCSTSQASENEQTSDRLKNMRNASVIPVIDENLSVTDGKSYTPLNYDFQKGIWLSYIDLAPMLNGNEQSFAEEFSTACQNIADTGLNTIYVHVRPFGDALYESQLFPLSAYIPKENNQALFDPLEIICDTAHEYGLSVHAWINPLRCQSEESFCEISDEFLTKQWYTESADMIKEVDGDGHLWLNPAYEEVRTLIADGAAEIAENYDVDAIHYDDYFYPTTDESFDSSCYAKMSGGDSLEQWRTDNISKMCEQIYCAVKSVDSRIRVEISPQGNIENNYEYMYADVKKWCSEEGYADCIIPQIYFGYENSVKPFTETLNEWCEAAQDGAVSLVIGLGEYKIGKESEFTDDVGIIAGQIADAAANEVCEGFAIYTYNTLFEPSDELYGRIALERTAIESAASRL